MSARERPILFSGEMVRAILDGRKSQTRRVVKPQPFEDDPHLTVGLYHPTVIARDGEEQPGDEVFGVWNYDGDYAVRCPFGQPGDSLWVRETWAQNAEQTSDSHMNTSVVYRADGETRARDNGTDLPWRPSIFMPRWASRLSLTITGVRVERLNDISEDDAVAEGQARHTKPPESTSTVEMFARTWDRINGKRAPWSSNPFVWVLDFSRAASPTHETTNG